MTQSEFVSTWNWYHIGSHTVQEDIVLCMMSCNTMVAVYLNKCFNWLNVYNKIM